MGPLPAPGLGAGLPEEWPRPPPGPGEEGGCVPLPSPLERRPEGWISFCSFPRGGQPPPGAKGHWSLECSGAPGPSPVLRGRWPLEGEDGQTGHVFPLPGSRSLPSSTWGGGPWGDGGDEPSVTPEPGQSRWRVPLCASSSSVRPARRFALNAPCPVDGDGTQATHSADAGRGPGILRGQAAGRGGRKGGRWGQRQRATLSS